MYIMALQSVLGWILFLAFAGWGVTAAPIDWLQQYLRRPRAVIAKSEYISRARGLAQRAKEIKATSDLLKRQDRTEGRTRAWRGNLRRLQRELATLEDDEARLDAVYPQGADGEARWVLYQLGFIALGLLGVIGIAASGAWIVHIILYMLPPVPVHPLLNAMFVALDGVFPLFGVAAFAAFCAYLMAVAIKGNFLLGVNFLVVRLYPVRAGATMTSSLLVNVALVLAMSGAITQFCAGAFAAYASSTVVFEIFGNDVLYLRGLRYIYQFNVFLYMFLGVAGLSLLWTVVRGASGGGPWRRAKPGATNSRGGWGGGGRGGVDANGLRIMLLGYSPHSFITLFCLPQHNRGRVQDVIVYRSGGTAEPAT
jgi:LMBR1 domain-containing protein 1